ncbi:hypothetical protein ACET3Z_030431 [Daucus carota]
MATKSFLLLPLALCLVFQAHYAAAQGAVMEKAAKESMVRTACAATTSPELCSTTLGAVVNSPYLDPTAITVTAVQAATKTAVAAFDIINMSLTVDVQLLADPSVRQSLSICASEYKAAIDSMNKAVSSMTQHVDTTQVPTLLNTAMGSVTKCDSSGIKTTNKVVQIAAKNIDCSKLIKNALEIYQVYATYIMNPTHDPQKGTAPIPNVGGGAGGKVGAALAGGQMGAAGGGKPFGGAVAGAIKNFQGSMKVGNSMPRPLLGGGTGGGYMPALMKGGSAGTPPGNTKR